MDGGPGDVQPGEAAGGLPLSSASQQPLSPITTPHGTLRAPGVPRAAIFTVSDEGGSPRQPSQQPTDLNTAAEEAALSTISLDDEIAAAAAAAAGGKPGALLQPEQHPAAAGAAALPTAAATTTAAAAAAAVQQAAAPLQVGDALLAPAAAVGDDLSVPQTPQGGTSIKVSIRDPERVELSTMGVVYSHYYTYIVRSEFNAAPGPGSAASSPGPSPARPLGPLTAALQATGNGAAAAAGGGGRASPQPGTPSSDTQGPAAAAAGGGAGGPESLPGNVVEVRRKFGDFEALHRLLKMHYPGFITPPVPMGSFFESRFAGDSFQKVRKVDLQAYLRAVVSHPVLGPSEEVRVFLRCRADLSSAPRWQMWMQERGGPMEALLAKTWNNSASASQHGGGGSGAEAPGTAGAPGQLPSPGGGGGGAGGAAAAEASKALFLRMKHSLLGVARPKPKQELSDEEVKLRQSKELLKDLQQHLSLACSTARSLVQHMEAVCEDFGGLARSLSGMARFDEAAAQQLGQYTQSGAATAARAADLQTSGYANMRQHNLWKQFSLRCAASLVFLHDYAVLVPEAITTLEHREAVLGSVELLVEELREKQAALAKTGTLAAGGGGSGGAAGSDKKAAQLQAQVLQLQEQLLAGQQHYRQLCERNRSELVRLNLEQTADFHRALTSFAAIQVQLSQAAADIWMSVHEELQQSRDKRVAA